MEPEIELPEAPRPNFVCQACQMGFDTLAKLKYHKLKLHGKWKDGLRCDICSKVYGSQSNLRRHLKIEHKTDPKMKPDPDGKVAGLKQCPECLYSTLDKYHLTIHMRKHTGDRPFKCSKCKFGFYKKSDLTAHDKICQGVQHQCSQCQEVFHFKKQLQEHLLWSTTCGKVTQESGNWPISSGPGERYLKDKPSMVRLNISQAKSVVALNCENLIDQQIFSRRSKKSRCGLCVGCEVESDCGTCKNCSNPSKVRICEAKKCSNRIFQYDLKKVKNGKRGVITSIEEDEIVESTFLKFEIETPAEILPIASSSMSIQFTEDS